MIKEGRETKQGIRDLNYYGPRRVKDGAAASPTAEVANTETRPDAAPTATPPSVDAQGGGPTTT